MATRVVEIGLSLGEVYRGKRTKSVGDYSTGRRLVTRSQCCKGCGESPKPRGLRCWCVCGFLPRLQNIEYRPVYDPARVAQEF